ncbi:MAG: hypothetical protein AB1505_11810 [Candidatus Latescibacterota bacterium]
MFLQLADYRARAVEVAEQLYAAPAESEVESLLLEVCRILRLGVNDDQTDTAIVAGSGDPERGGMYLRRFQVEMLARTFQRYKDERNVPVNFDWSGLEAHGITQTGGSDGSSAGDWDLEDFLLNVTDIATQVLNGLWDAETDARGEASFNFQPMREAHRQLPDHGFRHHLGPVRRLLFPGQRARGPHRLHPVPHPGVAARGGGLARAAPPGLGIRPQGPPGVSGLADGGLRGQPPR